MGQLQSTNLKKQYEQIYTLTYEACLEEGFTQSAQQPNTQLFYQIFSSFSQFKQQYQWAILIPYYIQKHFSNILQSVRKTSIQRMYKALNVTIFKQDQIQSNDDYQKHFYINIKNQNKPKQKKLSSQTMQKKNNPINPLEINNQANLEQSPPNPLFRQSLLFQKGKTSKKPETNAIVMKQSLFLQNLPQKAQQELGLSAQVYKRFAMVIESLMNSASFISLPLRHFQLNMKLKKNKKKLQTRDEKTKLKNKKIVQQTHLGEQLRKIQRHNQKKLLNEISNFTSIYTQFVWNFYNLDKMNETLYSKLINYQNIYNLMTNVIWTKTQWVGERGWEYEQYLSQLYLIYKGAPSQSIAIPNSILQTANNLSIVPIKYLRQIVIIYRQMSKLSKQMTADDLMVAYNRLFYEMAIRNKLRRVFRMIQIVNTLWEGEKFGEVGYAWITWQAGLQIILKNAQEFSLAKLEQQLKDIHI